MEKTYTLYPLEDDYDEDNCYSDDEDDCYSDPKGDHTDQFSLPFLRECSDFIDTEKESRKPNAPPVIINLKVTNTSGLILFEGETNPTEHNYLGTFDTAFDDFLFSHKDQTITVSVSIY